MQYEKITAPKREEPYSKLSFLVERVADSVKAGDILEVKNDENLYIVTAVDTSLNPVRVYMLKCHPLDSVPQQQIYLVNDELGTPLGTVWRRAGKDITLSILFRNL